MAALADLRQRIYDNLYSSAPHEHPFVTLLNEAGFDATETDVTLDAGVGGSFVAGDVMEIEDEQMLVTSMSTDVATVIRGWNNTTGAVHAENVPITKNPRFTRAAILNALVGAAGILEAWGVHGFGTGTDDFVENQTYYDLTDTDIADLWGVLQVYYPQDTTLLPIALPFRYFKEIHTTVSATGQGLHLWERGQLGITDTFYYTYASVLAYTSTLTAAQEELIVLGATTTLLGGTIGPSTHDPGARTDRTVAPGQTSRDVRFFQGQFFIQVRVEAARLAVERDKFTLGTVRGRRARRWVN